MFVLRPMPQDPATAVIAGWRERMDGTLKAVEDVSRSAESDVKGLVVIVAADFTSFHGVLREVIGEGKT